MASTTSKTGRTTSCEAHERDIVLVERRFGTSFKRRLSYPASQAVRKAGSNLLKKSNSALLQLKSLLGASTCMHIFFTCVASLQHVTFKRKVLCSPEISTRLNKLFARRVFCAKLSIRKKNRKNCCTQRKMVKTLMQ